MGVKVHTIANAKNVALSGSSHQKDKMSGFVVWSLHGRPLVQSERCFDRIFEISEEEFGLERDSFQEYFSNAANFLFWTLF